MSEREAFQAPINPQDHKLTAVLANYSFTQKAPCGLSTCRTAHHYGFLVRTASGLETNIGNVCGRLYFGDDFVTAESLHRNQVARRDALRTLADLRQHQATIEARISSLISGPFGIKWVRRLTKFLQVRLGADGLRLMARRVRSQDYKVQDVSELTETEIQAAMARTGRKRDDVRYKTEAVGTLIPMPWHTYDFKAILIDGLQTNLLIACNVEEATTETRLLKKLLKPLAGWEKTLEETQEVLKYAPGTLEPANLLLLLKAITPAAPGKKPPELSGWERTREYKHLLTGDPMPL